MSALADDAPRGFVPMREYLRLQRHCDDLEEKLASFADAESEGHYGQICADLHTTGQKIRILMLLCARDYPMGEARICEALGWTRINSRQIAVQVHRLRAQLKALGAPDNTVMSRVHTGYWLSPEGREWLRARSPGLFSSKGATR